MSTKKRLLGIPLIVVAMLFLSQPAFSQTGIVDLGTLGGPARLASDINDQGQVEFIVSEIVGLRALLKPGELDFVCSSPVAQKHKHKTLVGRFESAYFRQSQGKTIKTQAFLQIPDIDIVVVKSEFHFSSFELRAPAESSAESLGL